MAQTIQSLERGLKILDILRKSEKPLSLNQIAAHFNIDRSSIFRLLATLAHHNFVHQDPETKKYSLGFKIMELSGAFGEQTKIEIFLRPILKTVCEKTNQNAHLAILDRNEVVFIAVEQPRQNLSMHISVGTREPAFPTALGKVLLAFQNEDVVKKIVRSVTLKKYTQNTITSHTHYLKHLQEIIQQRFAIDNEEFRKGIICIAAPVFNHRGIVEYSIGISGTKEQINSKRKEYISIVKDASLEASRLLGMPT
ncbi:MAG: IclR family transcriptional regulator [Spirochaetes bacterium]|nr:IclR family transcriptional regulator [Spirochaetota bacterium]